MLVDLNILRSYESCANRPKLQLNFWRDDEVCGKEQNTKKGECKLEMEKWLNRTRDR